MDEHRAENRIKSLAKWKKKLTRENMAVVALLGLLLMVIAIPVGGRQEENAQETLPEEEMQKSFVSEQQESGAGTAGMKNGMAGEAGYAEKMEKQLEELLSAMEGVGETKVMVTIRASGQQVVEKDAPSESEQTSETDSAGGTRQSQSARREESTVYITDPDGNKAPYISQTTQPEIEGVTVVAQGGGDPLIQKNITEVIEALFDLEAHKIKVVKMK
ncbi:MAG TPA: stage III sporulation protein AG [Candidatus Eisenbergiella intestinipullorum]|nr:stage III sporulation protein AG [Candidatus Eisenbergiella intestinipullorum]